MFYGSNMFWILLNTVIDMFWISVVLGKNRSEWGRERTKRLSSLYFVYRIETFMVFGDNLTTAQDELKSENNF